MDMAAYGANVAFVRVAGRDAALEAAAGSGRGRSAVAHGADAAPDGRRLSMQSAQSAWPRRSECGTDTDDLRRWGTPDRTSERTPDMAARPFELKTSPGHLLRRAQQFAADVYQEAVGADGLTPRQFAVLYTVEAREGLSQTDLVRETGIDRSTLADMISRMLKKDLLQRKRTDGDQRANAVKITAAGRKALKAALPAVARAESAILDVIPASKRVEFIKTLTLIADKVDELENGPAEEPKKAAKKRR